MLHVLALTAGPLKDMPLFASEEGGSTDYPNISSYYRGMKGMSLFTETVCPREDEFLEAWGGAQKAATI